MRQVPLLGLGTMVQGPLYAHFPAALRLFLAGQPPFFFIEFRRLDGWLACWLGDYKQNSFFYTWLDMYLIIYEHFQGINHISQSVPLHFTNGPFCDAGVAAYYHTMQSLSG